MSLALVASLSGPAPLRADEADDQYAVAASHYGRQQWKLADAEFRTFLDRYPQHPQRKAALFYHAEVLLQLGRFEEGEARCRQYLKEDPAGEFVRAALFRAGEAAYLAGKLDAAKADLAAFQQKYPNDNLNAYVLPYFGEVSLAQNDAVQAENLFRQGLTRFPDGRLQDDCRYGLARALEKQEKYDEAGKLYLAVAGKTGNRLAADAQFRLGAVQYAMGKHTEAIDSFAAFETTFASNPRRSAARLGRGWALMKLGKPAEADKWFEQVLSDPKYAVEGRYWLGMSQRAQKKWTEAAKTLLETAQGDPRHPLAAAIRFHAGDSLLRSGDVKGAKAQFDLVLALSDTGEWLDDALRGKAQAALGEKDHETIDRLAAEFQKRCPQSLLKNDMLRLQARSLIERKQYQPAAQVLEPLMAVKEPGLEDRYLVALTYEGLKRYDDALKAIAPVLGAADAQLKVDAQLTQASVYAALKRYQEAIAPLESWLAAAQGVSAETAIKGRGLLAICYARTGQLDKAKKTFADLIAKAPPQDLLALATGQLAEAALDAGDAAWSNELFQRVSQTSPAVPEKLKGLSGLGWSQFKAGRLEEAAATFQRLLEQNPEPALASETALVRGQILEKLNRPDPALAMYDLVIQKHPSSPQMPQALLAAASLRQKLHQNQDAAALYERLAKEHPKLPEADAVLYQWAWALADLGRVPESTNVFERLRKEHPASRYWGDATFRLARRACEAKEFARARERADQLLSAKPDAPLQEHALYLKGQAWAGEGKWKEAGDTFARLAKDYPNGSLRRMAEYGAAEAIFRQADYGAAAARFEQLIQGNADAEPSWRAVVRLRLAQALCHQKKWKEALAIAAKIEAEFPRFEEQYEADYVIGRCLASRADPDFESARQSYQKAIRSPGGAKSETAAKAQLMLAETYFHQKNYPAALQEYLRVEILYAYPAEQAAALLQAGKCHELLGERKEASAVYTRLIDTWPEVTFAKEAAERRKTLNAGR